MNSQEGLTREGMEVRKHTDAAPNFHQACVLQFNDRSCLPFSTAYPGIHSGFVDEKLLEKGTYNLTVDKSKSLLAEAKPLLYTMVENYELSGNGAMSRYDEDADWGEFDIVKCNGVEVFD